MSLNSKIHISRFLLALISFSALFLYILPSARANSFIAGGHDIFFPKKLGETLESYKNFPVTWWNFLIFDMSGTQNGFEEAKKICDQLKNIGSDLISRVECQQDVKQYLPLLKDWARDIPLRHDRPANEELFSFFQRTLAKASLPWDKSILSHLRNDPLESDKELEALATQYLQFNLERKEGFLFDSASNHILIPVQFNFSPDRDELTSQFYDVLNQHCQKEKICDQWALVGSHASTWENKNRIMKDVALVSQIGMGILVFFCGGLLLMRRARLLFLIPPILFSMFLAVLATVLVYGSIHGLVLSFGTGLVGISYDYGSHSALNPRVKSIWAANWFGYLTTVAILGILMLSQISLLQQLMFFSTVGLTIAFFILFLLHRYFPEYARAKPFPLVPRVKKWNMPALSLVLLGLFFSWKIELKLDLSGFDFQGSSQRAASSWFFKNIKTGIPLFQIHEHNDNHSLLETLSRELDWGLTRGIQVNNAAVYLPSVSRQEEYLKTWQKACSDPLFLNRLDDRKKKFFKPYLDSIECDQLRSNDLSHQPIPSYVADFNSGGLWMTLWLPKNLEEAGQILSAFPQVTSLKSLANIFPTVLIKELSWMGPLSFVLVTLLLYLYFKNIQLTLIALIPFISGLGFVSWFHVLSGQGVSFINLMALVMVYGMSVDFGIFATDTYRHASKDEAPGVWTALFMAALTTVAGFIPLDFCKHLVLIDLGRTLTLGMIGAVLGTFLGVPFVLKRLKEISS